MTRTFYHTQEHRKVELTNPIICSRDDAWLGTAYYFWYYEEDAHIWGKTSKKSTGKFEVYSATIDCTKCLDTVFNIEHYEFWCKQIEKIATKIIKNTGSKPTIKELNNYLVKALGEDISGLMFEDISNNPNRSLVKPIQHRTKRFIFSYKKRIQLAVYNISIVTEFQIIDNYSCN